MTNLDKKILLRLFDASMPMTVSKKTSFPVTFPTSENHAEAFFITKLDQGYSAVLGYDWLVRHNLVIDWVETKVMFPNHWTEPKDDGPSKVNVRKIELDGLTELCRDPGNLIFTIDCELEAMFTKVARDDNQGEDESMEGVPQNTWSFRMSSLG